MLSVKYKVPNCHSRGHAFCLLPIPSETFSHLHLKERNPTHLLVLILSHQLQLSVNLPPSSLLLHPFDFLYLFLF